MNKYPTSVIYSVTHNSGSNLIMSSVFPSSYLPCFRGFGFTVVRNRVYRDSLLDFHFHIVDDYYGEFLLSNVLFRRDDGDYCIYLYCGSKLLRYNLSSSRYRGDFVSALKRLLIHIRMKSEDLFYSQSLNLPF